MKFTKDANIKLILYIHGLGEINVDYDIKIVNSLYYAISETK